MNLNIILNIKTVIIIMDNGTPWTASDKMIVVGLFQ